MRVDEQFAIVPLWVTISGVSEGAVALYAFIAGKYADGEGICWPGVEKLAEDYGKGQTAVKARLKELESIGAITRQRRIGTSTLTTINRSPSRLTVSRNGDSQLVGQGDQKPDPVEPDPVEPEICATSPANSSSKDTSISHPPGFELFWDRWPRRVRKKDAAKAYRKALDEVGLPAILEGLDRWNAYWKSERTEQRFIPHPSTWLNGGDYADPPPANESTNLFTDEERDAVLAKMHKLSPEEISRRRTNNEYPYDEETLSRLGETTR